MRLGLRIFAVYLLFVGLSAWFVFHTVMDEIRPGVRQSTEETLVDTANLLAELLREDLLAGRLDQARLGALLAAYGQRRPGAEIWGVPKREVSHRIYVTDASGIVLVDSTGRDVGADYSRWNDVYLTLRGRYGARSTPETIDGVEGSVMYVGAPIRDGERILGVVTVAKPSHGLQPYIERSQRRLAWIGGALVALGLAAGALLSWWLGRRLQQLTRWADAVSAGARGIADPPASEDELGRLARAMERMREQLEGKAHVERYVQALTHELKSPLSAIRGAAELLRDPLEAPDRERFAASVEQEAGRMQALVERLLELARLEQRAALAQREAIALDALAAELVAQRELRARQRGVRLEQAVAAGTVATGDRFLLGQALGNLLDNALDFTPAGGVVRIDAQRSDDGPCIRVRNDGAPIPDYALARLGERFYSLARPDTGRKGSGLGLAFCREIAALHGGRIEVRNVEGGVEACLVLPIGNPSA